MNTVNLSLTQDQITFIDGCVTRFGFSNRSEFMRSILRMIKARPHLMSETATTPFISPSTTSAKKILTEMKKTGKYGKEFLKGLEEGLSESSYFSK